MLATASLAALLAGMSPAAAEDCAAAAEAPPADLATPSMLYDTLRARTNAQLLAIGFLRKPMEETCAWIYEVKLLTASGSVVELDFDAHGLDLVGARGPDHDHDAASLVKNFGGDASFLTSGANKGGNGAKATASSNNRGGGEGGNSGSGSGGGSGNSGSGGGSGGGGSSGGSGGGEGGSGGGGDHDGGGEGGGGGSGGGGGEGGEGGGDD
ncbi:MAG: hypothetical protein R3D05_08650 [Dongiaceae bacterium]